MKESGSYGAIARVYDKLNSEIDYSTWADFVEQCFKRFLPQKPHLVLDLACGTGSMTLELAKRGYDMIGVDGSADMLSVAYSRSESTSGILYLMQDMRSFELYGTVGAAICCLDSINYLLSQNDLIKTFSLVHNYLDPDGIFLFDVNTPYKFENIYADNAYVLEDETEYDGEFSAVYCGWQNRFSADTKICDFYLTLFEEAEDGSYSRSDEHQRERCFTHGELTEALTLCGFEVLGTFADYNFKSPVADTERWYIAARAKKPDIAKPQ